MVRPARTRTHRRRFGASRSAPAVSAHRSTGSHRGHAGQAPNAPQGAPGRLHHPRCRVHPLGGVQFGALRTSGAHVDRSWSDAAPGELPGHLPRNVHGDRQLRLYERSALPVSPGSERRGHGRSLSPAGIREHDEQSRPAAGGDVDPRGSHLGDLETGSTTDDRLQVGRTRVDRIAPGHAVELVGRRRTGHSRSVHLASEAPRVLSPRSAALPHGAGLRHHLCKYPVPRRGRGLCRDPRRGDNRPCLGKTASSRRVARRRRAQLRRPRTAPGRRPIPSRLRIRAESMRNGVVGHVAGSAGCPAPMPRRAERGKSLSGHRVGR